MPFIKCINKINILQVDDAHNIDLVISMHNLMKYNNNYSKTSVIVWQYYRENPAVNVANSDIVDWNPANHSVKSVYIRSYSGPNFFSYSVQMRKTRTRITTNTNTFYAVYVTINLFKSKEKITGKTSNNDRKDVDMMVLLKHLSNFLRTLKMSLKNCENNIDLNVSKE